MPQATRDRARMSLWTGLALLLATLGQPGVAARGEEPSDDAFIEALATADRRAPIDRRRLAKLFFSVAATLEAGRSSIRLLHSEVPAAVRGRAADPLQSRFRAYTTGVARFQQGVSVLLDRPQSDLALYNALMDGQQACWLLDLHNRVLDSYGVGSLALTSILSSLEACARFRGAAFQPVVKTIVSDALAESARRERELVELDEELRALEQLVEDLRRINEGE